jgi:hypothetical protein
MRPSESPRRQAAGTIAPHRIRNFAMPTTTTVTSTDRKVKLEAEIARVNEQIQEKQYEIDELADKRADLEDKYIDEFEND